MFFPKEKHLLIIYFLYYKFIVIVYILFYILCTVLFYIYIYFKTSFTEMTKLRYSTLGVVL